MVPANQVGPAFNHRSAAGAIVIVKSRLGLAWLDSLNTLLSKPRFANASVGITETGPIRIRTLSGSGTPVAWANARGASNADSAVNMRVQRQTPVMGHEKGGDGRQGRVSHP